MQDKAREPLKGKTVVITRAIEQQGKAREMLESLGAVVLSLPVLIIGPPNNWELLDKALGELESFNWIVFSSANGVHSVETRLKKMGKSLSRTTNQLKVAAVGAKTAELLSILGKPPNFVPPSFIADSLVEHFPVSCKDLKILLPRVQSGGRTILADAFGNAGASVIEVAAYESSCPEKLPEETLKAIQSNKVDAIAFTSSKSALHTAELLKKYLGESWGEKLQAVQLISIGPQTTLSIQKYFGRVSNQADPHNLKGLTISCIQSLNPV